MHKRKWKVLRDYCLGWTLAFIFLSIVRGVGTVELGVIQFELGRTIAISILFGLVFGSLAGFAQILLEEKFYKRIPIQKFLLLRFAYAILFLLTIILTSYVLVTQIFGIEVSLGVFFIEPGSFSIYLYILSVDFGMVVLRQITLMLGTGNFTKLLLGKFYTPREEERVFMFVDLKSSTQLAEKLGHIEYSKLIQDCFDDLGSVIEQEAEIYQYVGDEVILTWEFGLGIKNQNCLQAYFKFQDRLNERADYYLNTYEHKPFFKAGIHAGTVTVTEVGKYKKEIAYHGDILNTTARIQSKCNEFGQALLASEHIKKQFATTLFNFTEIGAISLRGKDEKVILYRVEKAKINTTNT